VAAGSAASCATVEGGDLPAACTMSCRGACAATIEAFDRDAKMRTGLPVGGDRELRKAQRACARACEAECGKPGKTFDFGVVVGR